MRKGCAASEYGSASPICAYKYSTVCIMCTSCIRGHAYIDVKRVADLHLDERAHLAAHLPLECLLTYTT